MVSHDRLTHLLNFAVLRSNVLQAVGEIWSRDLSIPMGGLFLAKSANLHSLWGVKTEGKGLRDSG